SNAWNDMKEQLCATLRIPVVVDGVEKVLPLTAVRNLAHDANQENRKNAYFAEVKSYQQVEKAVAAALNSIKGEVLTAVALRGYSSPLHMTLVSSRMEEGTLKAMIEAMEDYLPSLRRFFKKKAELLGHKNGLPWYDLFAPTGKIDLTYSYEEAQELTLEQFYKFSKKLGDYTKHAFDSGWVDDTVREGKRGGAFCANIHAIGQSRVMLNHDGSFSNVITLAHEFGHAYHGECLKHVSYMNSVYSMPIAETASTFCESIVVDAILATADEDTKRSILEQEISKALQIIVDIYSRYLFELRFFEKRAQGVVSVEEINELMLQAQKDAYGDGLDPEYLHQYMWVNKPHYYYAARNFYNFPYAYGMMFSSGLYAQYLEQGEAFVQKYDDLLAATGSASLEAIGDLAGIDVRQKDFWLSALKVIEGKIDEFCK
ncbi:MAG: M3 family oligoendopeptidase, partial [Defluviitaleaceae bacterium]|nr:M3 family oligoendopeptidase [Defluviitaleaceae bacterium]